MGRRLEEARTWECNKCIGGDGTPLRNWADRMSCIRCQRSKGSCHRRNAPPNRPSTGIAERQKRQQAAEEKRQRKQAATKAKAANEKECSGQEKPAQQGKTVPQAWSDVERTVKTLAAMSKSPEVESVTAFVMESIAAARKQRQEAMPISQRLKEVEGKLEKKVKRLQKAKEAHTRMEDAAAKAVNAMLVAREDMEAAEAEMRQAEEEKRCIQAKDEEAKKDAWAANRPSKRYEDKPDDWKIEQQEELQCIDSIPEQIRKLEEQLRQHHKKLEQPADDAPLVPVAPTSSAAGFPKPSIASNGGDAGRCTGNAAASSAAAAEAAAAAAADASGQRDDQAADDEDMDLMDEEFKRAAEVARDNLGPEQAKKFIEAYNVKRQKCS